MPVIDPYLTTNATFAPRSTSPRPYDQITQVCTYVSGGVWTAQLTVGAPQPSWPDTYGSGDVGNQFEVCSDVTGPINSNPIVIGYGHQGEPLYAGPYPTSQGWKACMTAFFGWGLDCGVLMQDPNGSSTFIDRYLNNVFASCSWSGTTVTLQSGTTWQYTTSAGPASVNVQNAPPHPLSEPALCPDFGCSQNVVAQAFADTANSVPDNGGYGYCSIGSPLYLALPGCVDAFLGLGKLVNWAPGSGEYGDLSGIASAPLHFDPSSYDMGLGPYGQPQSTNACVFTWRYYQPPIGWRDTLCGPQFAFYCTGQTCEWLTLPGGAQALPRCANVSPGPSLSCGQVTTPYTYYPCGDPADGTAPGNPYQDEGDLAAQGEPLVQVDRITVTVDDCAGANVGVPSLAVYTWDTGRITGNDLPTVPIDGYNYHVIGTFEPSGLFG